MTELEQDRGERQLEKYRSAQEDSPSLDDSDHIRLLLVEVVSISGIRESIVPYVAIKMGGKVLHRTGYTSSDTGSVSYTLSEDCFFVLDMTLLQSFLLTE